MCGSGTIAIEAAMIATNRRPGLFRNQLRFHGICWDMTTPVYQREDALLEEQIHRSASLRIIATDYSKKAVENARLNAVAAGVAKLISFNVCDFAETEIPPNVTGVFM